MRTIVNKEVDFPNVKVIWDKGQITEANQLTEKTTYFKLFTLACETAPQGGWNKAGATELKKRLDLIDKLNVDVESIHIEENEYEDLKKCVIDNIIINSTSRQALDFTEYLDLVPKEEV